MHHGMMQISREISRRDDYCFVFKNVQILLKRKKEQKHIFLRILYLPQNSNVPQAVFVAVSKDPPHLQLLGWS